MYPDAQEKMASISNLLQGMQVAQNTGYGPVTGGLTPPVISSIGEQVTSTVQRLAQIQRGTSAILDKLVGPRPAENQKIGSEPSNLNDALHYASVVMCEIENDLATIHSRL